MWAEYYRHGYWLRIVAPMEYSRKHFTGKVDRVIRVTLLVVAAWRKYMPSALKTTLPFIIVSKNRLML